jgi:cytoskeletal protein CcmA (bactofilin family)
MLTYLDAADTGRIRRLLLAALRCYATAVYCGGFQGTMNDKQNPSFIQGATPRTVLFANSSISGKLSYNLPVKIDGHFTGEIKSTELLVIGSNAQVDAHISARQVHLEGRLVGSVQTMGCFELMPGGYFKGEARVGELRIHPGATFDGNGNVLGGT